MRFFVCLMCATAMVFHAFAANTEETRKRHAPRIQKTEVVEEAPSQTAEASAPVAIKYTLVPGAIFFQPPLNN